MLVEDHFWETPLGAVVTFLSMVWLMGMLQLEWVGVVEVVVEVMVLACLDMAVLALQLEDELETTVEAEDMAVLKAWVVIVVGSASRVEVAAKPFQAAAFVSCL